MHDQPTHGLALSPADRDDQLRAVVLTHLLDAYPAPFSLEELLTELSHPHAGGEEERDGLQRAVRDLSCSGLVHYGPEFIWPTRAAIHADALVPG